MDTGPCTGRSMCATFRSSGGSRSVPQVPRCRVVAGLRAWSPASASSPASAEAAGRQPACASVSGPRVRSCAGVWGSGVSSARPRNMTGQNETATSFWPMVTWAYDPQTDPDEFPVNGTSTRCSWPGGHDLAHRGRHRPLPRPRARSGQDAVDLRRPGTKQGDGFGVRGHPGHRLRLGWSRRALIMALARARQMPSGTARG